jgi:uncharacterized membrane protein
MLIAAKPCRGYALAMEIGMGDQQDQRDDPGGPLRDLIHDLSRRVDELALRLDTLENQATDSAADTGDAAPATPLPPAKPVPMPPPQEPPSIHTPARETAAATSWQRQEALHRLRNQPAGTKPAKLEPAKPARPSFDMRRLEWLMGARGLALAGVVILVIGVVMFLKLAWDEGWIGQISPVVRTLASAVFGLVLVATGEVLRRRVNALASSGTTAAGIATIYASIFAASQVFDLFGTPVAFSLMAVVTVAGILLGALSNRVMLALLSLIGAFAVPLLLRTDEPSFVVMPAYLLALLVLGLTLAGWRGGAYSHVRRLAWWSTGLLGTLWLEAIYDQSPASSLVFVSLVWMATVAELAVSARFLRVIRERTSWPRDSRAGFLVSSSGEILFDPRALFEPEARWINSAFGVSIWSVVAAAITLRAINPDLDFLAPLGFMAASLLAAVVVIRWKRQAGDNLVAVFSSPRSALAATLVVNGTLLGVAGIATALGGWVQVTAWAMIGLAAIETARRIRFRAAGVFGFALLAVAAGRLLSYDWLTHMDTEPGIEALGLAFTDWSPQVLFVAAACAAAAWRSRYAPERSLAACGAMWLAGASLVHIEAAVDSLGPALLVLAGITGWISAFTRVSALRTNAAVLAFVGMLIALIGQVSFNDESIDILAIDINAVSMIVAGLGWVALAAVPGNGYRSRTVFTTLAVICGGIAVASTAQSRSADEALVYSSLYAALVVAAGLRLRRFSLIEIASVPLWAVAIGWSAHQARLGEDAFTGTPILSPGFLAVLLTTAAAIWSAMLLARVSKPDDAPPLLDETRAKLASSSLALAWLLLLAGTSLESVRAASMGFEAESARGAALSIWWSVYAIASVALGLRKSTALRRTGLGLLGIVAAKVLLFDTVTLAPAARVVAAITVGLVIIAAGILYARLVVRDKDDDPPGPDQPEP